MKKVLAICLMMVMVLGVGAPAFAAPNGFVSSPSGNVAPTVSDFKPSDDDCEARLVITPYNDRRELPDTIRTIFEKAYNQITNADNLTELNAGLAKIANEKKIDSANLAIGDLFDIHPTDCDYHEGHVDFNITLDVDTLKHFVALLHMNKDGVWEVVENARVINNGEHLTFSVDSFSPFAIVVEDSQDTSDTLQTGENSMIYVYATIMAVSALAVIVIAIKCKKERA